jgi:2-oxoisovalerate dehydrogenase E1 component alpha subunit
VADRAALDLVHDDAHREIDAAAEQVMHEPAPQPSDVEKLTYAPSPVDPVYPDDYTGLP